MRVTGWTVPELRAAPAPVVRAHFARIYAGLIWNPELIEAVHKPMPPRAAFANVGAWAAARMARAQAVEALAQIEKALWPKDESDA